jgi:membrane-associated protease RseP (regulator of RpoE activity)
MGALGIVLTALAIFVSVCLHEAGHMLTAKRFGMKVTRYFAGFGPTLFSFRRGETEYGLKAIPLGGFVKIVGMTPQDDDVEPGDEARAMWRFPVWKRTIVMSAGSVTHFILGFVLLWITASFVGIPNPKLADYADDVFVRVSPCVQMEQADVSNECTGADLFSPASLAGLQDGDKITAINGTPVKGYPALVKTIRGETDRHITLTYVRGGAAPTTVAVKLTKVNRSPVDHPEAATAPTWALGIAATNPPGVPLIVKVGPVQGVKESAVMTGNMFGAIGSSLKSLPGKVPGLWSALQGNPRDPNGPVSVVGASEIGGQAASVGAWYVVLLLAATLNFFFGVFNLLPLLPLDGGHIAVAWYEKLRSWLAARRNRPDPGRVDYYKLMPVTYAVIFIFAAFSLLTILADVVNPINILGK